jgi:protein-L-isoaspartate(D-aspartate) O-methyltransferase
MTEPPDADRLREEMVAHQIEARGVRAPLVLAAMRKVRREGYVPAHLREFAFRDAALPIEEEQTISQPYIVALMVAALELEGGEKVLEVGTGSGYAAAVLAEIAGSVYTVERRATLAALAAERLLRDGYHNVSVRHGDGTLGWPEHAPFAAIAVAACGPKVPAPLQQQLAVGGRLVIPVGEPGHQQLLRIRRRGSDAFHCERLTSVRFVPLI